MIFYETTKVYANNVAENQLHFPETFSVRGTDVQSLATTNELSIRLRN